MPFRVAFTPAAQRQLEVIARHLAVAEARRLAEAISRLESNPYPDFGSDSPRHIKKLSTGEWRVRVGANYRIVYVIEDDTVVVTRVAHRKDVYRDF